MTDREALYRAVLARPADDLARGVYADWLEEHGERDRAAALRDTAAEVYTVDRNAPRPPRPKDVSAALDGLPDGWTSCTIRRGLAAGIEAPYGWFLAHAEAVFRHSPVTAVGLTGHEPLGNGGVPGEFGGDEYGPSTEWVWRQAEVIPGQRLLPWEVPAALWGRPFETVFRDLGAAFAALSVQCVRYGRRLAGLPDTSDASDAQGTVPP